MTLDNFKRHRDYEYYEKHKEEILADLRSTGGPVTRKKWNISSRTMGLLEKRWFPPKETQALTSRSSQAKSLPIDNVHNNLPSFPEFSNEWAESVQLKWFEIYAQLIRPTA